jgi:hypothetical protein
MTSTWDFRLREIDDRSQIRVTVLFLGAAVKPIASRSRVALSLKLLAGPRSLTPLNWRETVRNAIK